jgi:tetratricopeptide (TPR) repeat protein
MWTQSNKKASATLGKSPAMEFRKGLSLRMKAHLAVLSVAILLVPASFVPRLFAQSATAALAKGHVDEVIAQLTPARDAAAHNLLCRAYYSEDHGDEALGECQASVAAEPGNAHYQLWLGRVYGFKAGHSGAISAFGQAKKAHAAMEKAVQLDPKYIDAVSDLGDYAVSAPGIVGGGLDKASALAKQLLALDAPRGHRLLGEIAEKQKNLPEAEKEFTAAATGTHAAAGYVDLAAYYKRHGSKAQVLAAIKSVVAADTRRDYSISDAAGLLLEAGLDAKLAQQLYRSYLDGPSRSEDASACRVYTELGRNLATTGDAAGAQKAFAAALALAKNYVPAQKAATGK